MGLVLAVYGVLVMSSILTNALIFKPKKLKYPWECKSGFQVEFDARTAFNLIESAKDVRKYSGTRVKNHYLKTNPDLLREIALKRLYIIQSSQNNYIDWISVICGLFSSI